MNKPYVRANEQFQTVEKLWFRHRKLLWSWLVWFVCSLPKRILVWRSIDWRAGELYRREHHQPKIRGSECSRDHVALSIATGKLIFPQLRKVCILEWILKCSRNVHIGMLFRCMRECWCPWILKYCLGYGMKCNFTEQKLNEKAAEVFIDCWPFLKRQKTLNT